MCTITCDPRDELRRIDRDIITIVVVVVITQNVNQHYVYRAKSVCVTKS